MTVHRYARWENAAMRVVLAATVCFVALLLAAGAEGRAHGFHRIGERVALGTNVLGSARAIMKRWLHSSAQRRLLLEPVFRVQGAATKRGRVGRIPRAHIWVVHLGAHPASC
jgi:hypothetical protein